jgi:predicted lipid-binding transport protein (Tim44 family)
MIDIIIFALVTAFLLWKLKGILGKEDENRSKSVIPSIKDITGTAKDVSQAMIELKKEQKERKKSEIEEDIKQNLTLLDPKFEPAYRILCASFSSGVFDMKQFFDNVENFFTSLIEARNTKDLTLLAPQISPDVLKMLINMIEQEKAQNPNQKTELVKINGVEITDFNAFQDGSAHIKVKVLSEQIRYSKEGEQVVSGSVTIPSQFSDLLIIERVLKNKIYSWVLTKIE